MITENVGNEYLTVVLQNYEYDYALINVIIDNTKF